MFLQRVWQSRVTKSGFALVEMMVAMLLLSIMLSALYGFFCPAW